MRKAQIDCYGFEATSQWFKRRKLEPYLFMHVDDVFYLRYSAAERGPIHRIDRGTNGELWTMWAYGEWGHAPDLSYVPINETMEVEVE